MKGLSLAFALAAPAPGISPAPPGKPQLVDLAWIAGHWEKSGKKEEFSFKRRARP